MLKLCLANNLIPIAKSFFELFKDNEKNNNPDNPVLKKEWEDLDEEERWPNINMVLKLEDKLASIGCHISENEKGAYVEFSEEEREILSKKEHEIWFEEKEENGWIYYPVPDIDNKRHPDMVPWNSLDTAGKERNYSYTDKLIGLLRDHEIYIHKDKEAVNETDPQTPPDYYKEGKVPIILSVTGHTDIIKEDEEHIKSCLDELYNTLKRRYPNTDLILMSAMAEGADRFVVKWAFEKGIPVGPVLPISIDEYKATFSGIGYGEGPAAIEASKKDFDGLLYGMMDGKRKGTVYTPIFTTKGKQNKIRCFCELSAYLVSNSHILIGLWDGRECGLRGGTYDTIRMAYKGVDHDLIECIPATSVVFGKDITGEVPILNAGEDALVYWIETRRKTIDCAPDKEARDKAMKDKFIQDENSKNRKPGTSHGFFYDKDLQVYGELSWSERIAEWIDHKKSKISKKQIPPVKDELITIGSSPIFGDVKQIYKDVPRAFDITFRHMDRLNSKPLILRELEDIDDKDKGFLFGEDKVDEAENTEIIAKGCMSDMERRFLNTFNISGKLKFWSRFNSFSISILQILSTAIFSFMILFSGSIVLSLFYSLVYVILTFWLWLHRKNKIHTRYVEWRSMSESLRVQYYWSVLGINDTVSTNCYGYLKNGMSWTRSALKGFCSAFVNDYSKVLDISKNERIEFAKNYWIKEKIAYLKKQEKGVNKKVRLDGKLIFVFESLSMLLAGGLSVLSLAYMENLDVHWFNIDGLFDPSGRVLFPDADFTTSMIIKIGIIITAFLLSLVISLKTRRFTDTPQQYEAKMLLYELVIKKFEEIDTFAGTYETRNEQNKMDILHEIGILEIDQNNDWVFEFIGKDVKKPGNERRVNEALE